MDELAEFGLSSDEAVRNVHFSAESGDPDNELDGINIVGNDNKLGFSLFNQLCDMVKSEFEMEGLWFLNILFWITISLLSAFAFASEVRRAFLSFLSSGEYFLRSLNKTLVWFLSRAFWNWAMMAGTLILERRILFCLWKAMYLGHLTNLVRFLLGWMLFPTLKLRGLLWKRGLVFLSAFLATFLFLFPLPYVINAIPFDLWCKYY